MNGILKKINTLSNKIKREIDKKLSKYGITFIQARFILFISKSQGDIYQKDLLNHFEIRKSSITSILQLMERDGLIVRESNNSDYRFKKIILTDKALSLSNVIRSIIYDFENQVLSTFSADEKKLLLMFLSKTDLAIENLSKE